MEPELTAAQLRVVTVVYLSSLVPLAVLAVLQVSGRLPRWIAVLYASSFALCAAGWEIWLTFGIAGGDPVDARRAAALNAAIPQSINWLLNSLADAGSICLAGVFFVWLAYGRSFAWLRQWRWAALAILFVWFLAQNVAVELFLYRDQLAIGKPLSWAPLIPTGAGWNPTLFEANGRSIQLQTQLPWLLMTPLFYALASLCHRRLGPPE